jgi:sucrose-6-phosphate hydrolase SacC (GH32 family)
MSRYLTANKSAGAAERSAAAAERGLALATEVTWSLTHVDRSRYLLTNTGRETAYAVRCTADFVTDDASWDHIAGGEAVEFFAGRTYGDTDDRVTVTWHRVPDLNDDEPSSWRHALPE